MTCSVYIGASIDGFIAARDGSTAHIHRYGGVQEAVRAATDAGRHRLYVDGRRTIQLFPEEDLIEELLSQRYELSWEASFAQSHFRRQR